MTVLPEEKVLGQSAAAFRRVAKGEELVPHCNLAVGEGGGEGRGYGGRNKLRPFRVGYERETALAVREEHELGLVACGVERPGDGRGGTVCADGRHVVSGHVRWPVASHCAGDDAGRLGLHVKGPLFACGGCRRHYGTDRYC